MFSFKNCMSLQFWFLKTPYNILTSPDISALLFTIQLIVAKFVFCTQALITIIPLKVKQITPLSMKQSLYYGSPIVSQLHFPLSKLHCHKLQEKIILKLVIIYYTVTQHKPSVRMDTYIDFNDSYIFFDSYI